MRGEERRRTVTGGVGGERTEDHLTLILSPWRAERKRRRGWESVERDRRLSRSFALPGDGKGVILTAEDAEHAES